MDQKKIDLLKKLKTLAEQGIGGEKETAQKKLEQLMQKYNVEEQELSDDVVERYEFRYHGEFEKKTVASGRVQGSWKEDKRENVRIQKRHRKEDNTNN